MTNAMSISPELMAAAIPPKRDTAPAPPVAPPRRKPGVIPKISATSSGQKGWGYAVGIVTPKPWPWRSLRLSPASSNASCSAHDKYSALDVRGSPGFEPRRSVGVSPIATIAALPRILINDGV